MAFRGKKKGKEDAPVQVEKEKILDVDASMRGSLAFRDPVNLRINGKFEGNLETKGNLMIGEKAQIKADINGESIVISGRVIGNVIASGNIDLTRTAYLKGDISTPRLSMQEGAILQGKCDMPDEGTGISRSTIEQALLTVEELAKYLEVETSSVLDWAKRGRIPAQKDGNSWKFDRIKVDAWIASEKIK